MDVSISLGGIEGMEVGTVEAQKMTSDGDCLLIDIKTGLICMGEKIPYEKCHVYLHGSVACIRGFADAIIAALPDEHPKTEELSPAVLGAILGYVEAQEKGVAF